MSSPDRDLRPHRELFRRPSYWLLLALPIVFFGALHAVLARAGHPAAGVLPVLGTVTGYFYAYHLTQWLRRRR